jgi:hypothetical protein
MKASNYFFLPFFLLHSRLDPIEKRQQHFRSEKDENWQGVWGNVNKKVKMKKGNKTTGLCQERKGHGLRDWPVCPTTNCFVIRLARWDEGGKALGKFELNQKELSS